MPLKKLRKSDVCLNCGFQIEEFNYCPDCGQLNTNKHVSIRHFFKEFADEFFTFDSKFFKSFVPLIKNPGHLTNEYTKGKRVRYILPLRLYIFVTFLFFLVLSINVTFFNNINIKEASNQKKLGKFFDKNFEQMQPELKTDVIKKLDKSYIIRKRMNKPVNFMIRGVDENSWLSQYFKQKIVSINNQGKNGINSLLKEAVNQIPKVMFFLLPLFALLMKLLYIRHKIYYIKHLVFALHVHTFFFLTFILILIFPKWYIITVGLLGIYVYFYNALRKVYQQGKFKTFFKMQLIWFFYLLFLPFGITALALLAIISN